MDLEQEHGASSPVLTSSDDYELDVLQWNELETLTKCVSVVIDLPSGVYKANYCTGITMWL